MDLKFEIKKFFKGDLEDSEEVLTKYSHDASLLEVRPKLVAFPKNSEDIKKLVVWVNENKAIFPYLSITSRSAGTCMSGGAIGESIILDFTRYMSKIEKITRTGPVAIKPKFTGSQELSASGEATVLPGCY